MRPNRLLAIECGASHVACGLFRAGAGGWKRVRWTEVEFVVDPADDRGWIAGVAGALAELFAREKYPVRDAILAIPAHLALTKFVKTPAVTREQRHRVAQFEAAQAIPQPLDEVAWGYAEVADDGVDVELMLASVRLEAVTALCDAVESAGFRVIRAVPVSLALARLVAANKDRDEPSLLLADLGGRSIQLAFAAEGRAYVRALAFGGNAVTQALAESLHLDFVAAERLKLQVLSADGSGAKVDALIHAAVIEALAGLVGRLQLEVTRSRLGFSRQYDVPAPARMLVAGGGAGAPGLIEELARRLELPVARLAPLEETRAEMLTSIVGLADEPTASMDLLPPARRRVRAARRREAWWLAGAALIAFALLPPLLYFHFAQVRANRQIRSLERELAPLRRIARANADRLEELRRIRTRIAAVRTLAEGRADWVAFLGDLQSRLAAVGDVWLDRLEADSDESPVKEEGGRRPLRLALEGRLLDTSASAGGAEPTARVNALLAGFTASPFVQAVENEHYDNQQAGVLRFEVTLVIKTENSL